MRIWDQGRVRRGGGHNSRPPLFGAGGPREDPSRATPRTAGCGRRRRRSQRPPRSLWPRTSPYRDLSGGPRSDESAGRRLTRRFTPQETHQLTEVARRPDLAAAGDRRLAGVLGRDDDPAHPAARAQAAIGNTPRTGRSVPSSASSPTKQRLRQRRCLHQPGGAEHPDGDRDVVRRAVLAQIGGGEVDRDRRGGSLNPLFSSAPRMRTRPSRTPASASPTMLQQGSPIATSTSTSIGVASIPTTAAEATRANMPPDIAKAMPARASGSIGSGARPAVYRSRLVPPPANLSGPSPGSGTSVERLCRAE